MGVLSMVESHEIIWLLFSSLCRLLIPRITALLKIAALRQDMPQRSGALASTLSVSIGNNV